MAEITIEMAPEVRASDTFRPHVERANEWLRENLSDSDFPVRVQWTPVGNREPEATIALTLRDEFSANTRLFRARNFQERAEAEHDLNSAVGVLLRHRTHQLLKRLQTSLAEGD